MWDVLSGDFDKELRKNGVYNCDIKNASPGSMIVFHDSEKAFQTYTMHFQKFLIIFLKKGSNFCL